MDFIDHLDLQSISSGSNIFLLLIVVMRTADEVSLSLYIYTDELVSWLFQSQRKKRKDCLLFFLFVTSLRAIFSLIFLFLNKNHLELDQMKFIWCSFPSSPKPCLISFYSLLKIRTTNRSFFLFSFFLTPYDVIGMSLIFAFEVIFSKFMSFVGRN